MHEDDGQLAQGSIQVFSLFLRGQVIEKRGTNIDLEITNFSRTK